VSEYDDYHYYRSCAQGVGGWVGWFGEVDVRSCLWDRCGCVLLQEDHPTNESIEEEHRKHCQSSSFITDHLTHKHNRRLTRQTGHKVIVRTLHGTGRKRRRGSLKHTHRELDCRAQSQEIYIYIVRGGRVISTSRAPDKAYSYNNDFNKNLMGAQKISGQKRHIQKRLR
jgi:hypothetical protein